MYTKENIIEKCKEASSKEMKFFYKADVLNYRGQTKDKVYYTEIVAEWLLNNLNKLDQIEPVERKKDYNIGHTGSLGEKTNRAEEYLAKQLFLRSKAEGIVYSGFGKIIDYQTPLKAHNDIRNKGLGKIDLLSVNDVDHSVYLLELKKKDSIETMLRCVLESYTYLRIVSKEKLFSDFHIPMTYELKASPLVFFNGYQYSEYFDSSRKNLRTLMEKLNSKPFFIDETPAKYKIVQFDR
jgi:hypothetical protein